MAVLTGPEIVRIVNKTREAVAGGREVDLPAIDITPFNPAMAGPNSYDLTLADKLLVYATPVLDSRTPNPTNEIVIPPEGFLLKPGELYLGATAERTACYGLVPMIETRSSIARLGISTHLSAGFGDDALDMHWTLELTAVKSVRIYAGMRIVQIVFSTLVGDRKPYAGKYQHSAGPVSSRFWQDPVRPPE